MCLHYDWITATVQTIFQRVVLVTVENLVVNNVYLHVILVIARTFLLTNYPGDEPVGREM